MVRRRHKMRRSETEQAVEVVREREREVRLKVLNI